MIVGPPAAGKTTWLRDHAKHGDITIDFNEIAAALTPVDPDAKFPEHTFPEHVRMVAQTTRLAAIDAANAFADMVDVYVIHAMPSRAMLAHYDQLGATIVTIDPQRQRDIVTDRLNGYGDRGLPPSNGTRMSINRPAEQPPSEWRRCTSPPWVESAGCRGYEEGMMNYYTRYCAATQAYLLALPYYLAALPYYLAATPYYLTAEAKRDCA